MVSYLDFPQRAEKGRIMENKSMVKRKMKLNINGRFKTFWTQLFLKRKIMSVGVDVHEVKNTHPDNIEMVVSGTKANLWGLVKWSKEQNLFVELNEVVFEFVD